MLLQAGFRRLRLHLCSVTGGTRCRDSRRRQNIIGENLSHPSNRSPAQVSRQDLHVEEQPYILNMLETNLHKIKCVGPAMFAETLKESSHLNSVCPLACRCPGRGRHCTLCHDDHGTPAGLSLLPAILIGLP